MRKKNRRKKKQAKRILFILIILLGVTFYLIWNPGENSYEVVQKIDVKAINCKYEVLKNKIVVLEEGNLIIYDGDKVINKHLELDLSDSSIDSVGDLIFITEKKSGIIYILDDQLKKINTILLEKEIIGTKVDKKSQYIGIHVRSTDSVEEIIFFNNQGQETGRIGGMKEGKIMDFTFDSKEKIVVLSTINFEEGIRTNIIFSDIYGKIKGAKLINNELIPKIYLTEKGDLIGISENRIIKMNKEKEIIWERKMKVDKAEYSPYMNTIILCQIVYGKTEVILLDEEGNELYKSMMDEEVEEIIVNSKKTILYGKRTICELSKSKLKETKIFKDIRWADIKSDGKIVIGNNQTVEVLSN